MAQEIFSRYELKYVITMDTYRALAEALAPYTRFDGYGDQLGRYTIISLYFDSPDHKIYYETRNKLRFRQKLRLRVYNQATLEDQAFLEVKQKFKNVVNKRRTILRLGDAYDYIQGEVPERNLDDFTVSNQQILREIDSFKHLYKLHPRNIVSYDRQAFQSIAEQEQDLRITFDYNVRCREDHLRLEYGADGQHILDPQLVILEVKVSHSVPFWLSRLLSDLHCQRQSFSKYCSSIELTNAQNETEQQLSSKLILSV